MNVALGSHLRGLTVLRGDGAASGGCKASHARLVDLDGEPGDEVVVSFSGEPRGERCPTGGSIQVWKAKTSARAGDGKPRSGR